MKNSIKIFAKIMLISFTFFTITMVISCSKNDDAPQQIPSPLLGTIVKDVYACGEQYDNYALFWKNGIKTFLTDGGTLSKATEIIVSGSDVYLVGSQMLG